MTIYDLKPMFQQLLMPIVDYSYKKGITPNFVTLLDIFLSIAMGTWICLTNGSTLSLIMLPLFMFIRKNMS